MKTLLLLLTLLAHTGYSYPMLEQFKDVSSTTLSYLHDSISSHPYATTAFLSTSLALAAPYLYYRNSPKEERWDWSTIDTSQVSFPDGFLIGAGESDPQTGGRETAHGKKIKNTWTEWEKQLVSEKYSLFTYEGILKKLGLMEIQKKPRTPKEERIGFACHRWSHYKEDVRLLKKIGIKVLRYSLEWCKIEPEEGVYDIDALQYYINFTQELINNDIIPCPNLFHHTLPLWYAEKGSFEKAENIEKFVEYAVYVFNKFKEAGLLEKTKVWFAFNEAIGFVLAAYVDGKLPPGKKMHLKQAGIVAKNMLDTHIRIYDKFNKIDNSIKLGFIHVMMPMTPYNPQNPIEQFLAKTFEYLVNDVALEYFRSGNFNWLSMIKDNNPNAINKIDILGVNYYSHTLLSMTGPKIRPDEICADGYPGGKRNKPIYAEGLYQTLKHAASYGFPLVITEFGFAAKLESVELRTQYFKQTFYAMHKAMQEGVPLYGCFLWTGFDGFGWNSGQHSTHGIYHVNHETQERTLKDNAWYFVEMLNKAPSDETIVRFDQLPKMAR
jgi:beta-glucosidase